VAWRFSESNIPWNDGIKDFPRKMLVNQAKEAKSEEAPKTEDETHENEG
jgi:hypothetical protein